MAVVTLAAGRLDPAGVVASRTWTRVPVVLAAAGDTIRVPVPPGVGRIAMLRIEAGVETVRPVVDGVQASLASVAADWRLTTHGQVFTPAGPPIRDASGEVIGRSSIDIVPTLQGAPALPATVYVSIVVQEGAGAVTMGGRGVAAADVDMLGYAVYGLETPDGSDTTQAATVGYLASLYQPLAANLTALAALVGAADRVPYFTGAGAMALATFGAAARTFLASFPTPTLAAALAMAGFKITGLGQPTTLGDALRFESQGPGTFATIAALPTQILATNVTRTVFADGERGVSLIYTSATATPRLSGQVAAGTSVTAVLDAMSTNPAGSYADGGVGIMLARPVTDGKLASLFAYRSSATAVLFLFGQWTDKDTYNATRGSAQLGEVYGSMTMRLRSSGGNIIAEYSIDGVNWTNIATVAEATFFAGVAGTPTQAGAGEMSTQSGVSSGLYRRVTVA